MSESSINSTYFMTENSYNMREPKAQMLFENLIWLTTDEAAIYLRKSADAIRHLVYRGDLKARKFKRRLYFRRDELDELLDLSVF